MVQNVKMEGLNIDFDPELLSVKSKAQLEMLIFITNREKEILLERNLLFQTKNCCITKLKEEILSNKAGLLLADN